MSNPWDVPTPLPLGDNRVDDTFTAVGRALSSWEQVEESLADLFALFTGSVRQFPDISPAIRAYGSVISFKGRTDMVQAAGQSFFHSYKIHGRTCPYEAEFLPLLG
jgi:hypothetical protein